MSVDLSSSLQNISAFRLLGVRNPSCNHLRCWQMLCWHLEFRITSQQETCHVFNVYAEFLSSQPQSPLGPLCKWPGAALRFDRSQ